MTTLSAQLQRALGKAAGTAPGNRHYPSPWFAERTALYFGALFLIYGVHVTSFPVWLSWRGLTPGEISLVTAVPIFIRTILTPAVCAYSDTRHNHRQMIIGLSVLCLALTLGLSQSYTFWPVFLLAVPFSIALATIMPLNETIAVSGVRTAGHDYGRMRLWGSATFLIATVITGMLVDRDGPGSVLAVLIAATLATAAASLLLPKPAREHRPKAAESRPRAEREIVKTLLGRAVFIAFLVSTGATLGSHAAFYTFGALHFKTQGLSGTAFGALWTTAIIGEMALLAFSAPLVRRFGPVRLMMVGAAAAILRWGATSLDPPFAVMIILQALHALTYGATHVGAIHFIARAVPVTGGGTAQALYASIGSGLFTGAATLLAGQIYPTLGGQTFLAMAALAGTGLGAAIFIEKTWNKEPLIAEVPATTPAPEHV